MTLQLRDVGFDRNGTSLLTHLSLMVPKGATALIRGENGAGKTTLLRLIAGLECPASGDIRFGDEIWHGGPGHRPTEARGIGMVFQDLVLWPHLRIADQIALTLHAMSRAARRERLAEVLAALQLETVAKRFPGELSGGQQQRAAIARALARRPRLALLDEPTNQMDAATAERVSRWLRSEQIASGRIIVLVSHDRGIGRLLGAEDAGGQAWTLAGGLLRPQAEG